MGWRTQYRKTVHSKERPNASGGGGDKEKKKALELAAERSITECQFLIFGQESRGRGSLRQLQTRQGSDRGGQEAAGTGEVASGGEGSGQQRLGVLASVLGRRGRGGEGEEEGGGVGAGRRAETGPAKAGGGGGEALGREAEVVGRRWELAEALLPSPELVGLEALRLRSQPLSTEPRVACITRRHYTPRELSSSAPKHSTNSGHKRFLLSRAVSDVSIRFRFLSPPPGISFAKATGGHQTSACGYGVP